MDAIKELEKDITFMPSVWNLSIVDGPAKLAKHLCGLGYRKIPPDHVIVPREPTEAMTAAADVVYEANLFVQRGYGYDGSLEEIYRAMIATTLPQGSETK